MEAYITEIAYVEKMIKANLTIYVSSTFIEIDCDNKCKLLSHLLHRANLDVHCNKEGHFNINFNDYSMVEILEAFETISNNPQWIIEFVEKYLHNQFMLDYTFENEVEA